MVALSTLLMDIGAAPLPMLEPIDPVNASWFPVAYSPPPLPAPIAPSATAVVDGAQLRWTVAVTSASTVVETAPDEDGDPGDWVRVATVDGASHLLSMTEDVLWVRLRTQRNGRESEPGLPLLATRIRAATEAAVIEAQATADHADALTEPGSGVQLGDQRQLKPVSVGSVRSVWDGLTLTSAFDSGDPAEVTLSASAATLRMGTAQVNYAASSATLTQARATTVRYYAYYLDPGYSGGAHTLNVSTDVNALADNDDVQWVGEFVVVVPATGGGTGGGSGGGGGGRPPGSWEPEVVLP